MADPRIEAFKRFALQQAALQQQQAPIADLSNAAPDDSMITPAGVGGATLPLPQMGGAPPSFSMPNQSAQQSIPQVTAPQPVQSQPGPIKSFLSNFVNGAGQGLLAKVGLETDAEKQQRMFNQAQTVEQNRRLAQQADAMSIYRQQQAAKLGEQTDQLAQLNAMGTVPDTDEFRALGLAGQPMTNAALQGLQKVMAQNQGKYDAKEIDLQIAKLKYGDGERPGPLNTQIKDINGHSLLLRRGTGEVLKDLGPANSIATAYARARAMAEYRIVPTVDTEGNPTVTSAASALQGGTPSVPFTQSRALVSDKAGLEQYESILKTKIQPNLGVLNDNVQRGIIAHTLQKIDENPGAMQSILTAGAQEGLSPQGAALVGGILQSREFGGVARKYGGNLNGTEGLQRRIASNQTSPLNAEAINRELIQNDLAFTAKARGALGGLTKRGVSTGNAPATGGAPTSTTSSSDPFAKYGGRSR